MFRFNLITALVILLAASSGFAEGETTLQDSPRIFRLKSGINSPEQNGEVTHFTPIALDAVFRTSESFGLGVHFMASHGNHMIASLQGSELAGFNLAKTMVLPMVSGNYFFDFGHARVGVGIKAGALFYSEETTLTAGVFVPTTSNSNTLFTAGPSIDLDLPLKGSVFANIGGDYMVSQSAYQFGSLYVGLGLHW